MIEVRPADEREEQAWQRVWLDRLRAWGERVDRPAGWTERRIVESSDKRRDAAEAVTLTLLSGNDVIGFVAARRTQGNAAAVDDIWIAPEHRGRGFGAAALGMARDWARTHATSLWADIDPGDRAHVALFGAWPVRSQRMVKRLVEVAPLPAGVMGRPMSADGFAQWHADGIRGYAADMVASGARTHEDAMNAAAKSYAELLPDGMATAANTFWTMFAGELPVATNWLAHGREPGLSFVFDVHTVEAHRGHGYGRAAMFMGEQAALDAGDTHLGLNVFGHNEVAIGLYTSMGFHVVEQSRSIDL